MDGLALIYCLRFAWLFLLLSAGYLLKSTTAREKRSALTAGELLRWKEEHPNSLNGFRPVEIAPSAVRKFLFFIATAWILSPSIAHSAIYTGADALGSAAWSRETCSRFLSIVANAKQPAMTFLWESSFGDSLECPMRFLDKFKERDHLLKIVFSNEVCRRNHDCEAGDFFRTLSVKEYNTLLENEHPIVYQAIADRLEEIKSFVTFAASEKTQVVLTLGLEDNYSEAANANLSDFVKDRWPWVLIRNPLGSHKHPGAALFIESHGSSAKCGGNVQVVSQDGSVMSSAQSAAWLKRNRTCFNAQLWQAKAQGWTAGNKPKGARKDRTFSISDKEVRELGNIIREDTK